MAKNYPASNIKSVEIGKPRAGGFCSSLPALKMLTRLPIMEAGKGEGRW